MGRRRNGVVNRTVEPLKERCGSLAFVPFCCRMKKIVLLWGVILGCCACMDLPADVEEALALAGGNRRELKAVLRHYRQDSLKFRAACFLIANMRWHYSDDSGYCLYSDAKDSDLCDLRRFDRSFLISHVDHAFDVWESSPCAAGLSFCEFCEYILPYRSLAGYPDCFSGAELYDLFGKYVGAGQGDSLAGYVARYNRVKTDFEGVTGKRLALDSSLYRPFFPGRECTDVAVIGCQILRACGLPVMVEFCNAYRDFPGRHFYCTVRDDRGRWWPFNPETSLPGEGKSVPVEPMNLYRQYFGAQRDNPFFLKAAGEYVPPLFDNPCLREVTGECSEVFRVTLPWTGPAKNRLVYLAAFQAWGDMAPVTWAEVDTLNGRAVFTQVMPDRLYFPVYYEGRRMCVFGEPFVVARDSLTPEGFTIQAFRTDTTRRGTVVLTRKFPRKPAMIRLAERLVGGVFVGANREDFSDARVLYTLTEPPVPCLQDAVLRHPGAFRYYRFIAPPAFPQANLAMLEFLTRRDRGYTNVAEPGPAAVLSPDDTLAAKGEKWVKLLDAPSWEEMKWKPEYDGNMLTAPGAFSTITLRLAQPQVVERIRFAPQNADNGIRRGDLYELFGWGKQGWHSYGKKRAEYEFLLYDRIPAGEVLWLRNYSEGREELPFIVEPAGNADGFAQRFIRLPDNK
ncbi:MAG: hypothetical protein ACLR5I_12420 [Odoribacter splanchnicus]|uniref:hypothetical protein n=2 Tax=Odoribacter splanchnicus TaxID=28118 RepID=UPI0015850571|nr:hypothetical protein [Odoribacter splanchnicus]NUN81205.1 hypothetical protein [Odoribacter splanchnicus]